MLHRNALKKYFMLWFVFPLTFFTFKQTWKMFGPTFHYDVKRDCSRWKYAMKMVFPLCSLKTLQEFHKRRRVAPEVVIWNVLKSTLSRIAFTWAFFLYSKHTKSARSYATVHFRKWCIHKTSVVLSRIEHEWDFKQNKSHCLAFCWFDKHMTPESVIQKCKL